MDNIWWVEEQEKLLLKRLLDFGMDFINPDHPESRSAVFLGQIPMSEKELERAEAVVLEVLRGDPVHGPDFLAERAPTHFALFLVWQGIRGYRDGDYWTAIHEATGIADRQLEARWGRDFLEFLDRLNLPSAIDVGGYKYVTSILLHGGIPDSCLPEYFREVAWNIFVRSKQTGEKNVRKKLQEMRERAAGLHESGLFDRLEALVAKERGYQRALRLIPECLKIDKDLEETGKIRKEKWRAVFPFLWAAF